MDGAARTSAGILSIAIICKLDELFVEQADKIVLNKTTMSETKKSLYAPENIGPPQIRTAQCYSDNQNGCSAG